MIISPSSYPVEWDRPTEIRTQFLYRCSVKFCGRTLIQEYLGLVPQIPTHPCYGWTMVCGEWVCPGHDVEVRIDGNKLG